MTTSTWYELWGVLLIVCGDDWHPDITLEPERIEHLIDRGFIARQIGGLEWELTAAGSEALRMAVNALITPAQERALRTLGETRENVLRPKKALGVKMLVTLLALKKINLASTHGKGGDLWQLTAAGRRLATAIADLPRKEVAR